MRHPIYSRPDPSRMGDIDFVLEYAVNFDGYAYAHEHDIDIESLANDRLHQWQNCGEWQGTFEEMRLCLFVEQRLDHHVGRDPEIEAWILDLYGSICDSSRQRQGVNRALHDLGGEPGFPAATS